MTDQFAVYAQHAARYQELVSYEDIDGNLGRLLKEMICCKNSSVIEAGVGTGRVAALYAASVSAPQKLYLYDQSAHMLEYARQRFADLDNVHCEIKTHAQILTTPPPASIFIEGWAFGHWFLALYPDFQGCFDTYFQTLKAHLKASAQSSRQNEVAQIVLIETLGTLTDAPFSGQRLNLFYDYLEQQQGFDAQVIRTDYVFPSVSKAAELMGFFFGEDMAAQIQRQNLTRIPEYTGVWCWKPKAI